MKRFMIVLFSLIMVTVFTGCNKTEPIQDEVTIPNGDFKTVSDKDSVSEFISVFGKIQGDGLLTGYDFSEKNCFHVTPEDIRTKSNLRIFKFGNSCLSFIMIDGEVYELCNSFGGFGFIDGVFCDFDNDGNEDILVSSSWGSGLHRSEISVFNTKTKESTILFSTIELSNPAIDLCIQVTTPNENEKVYYIHEAKLNLGEHLAEISYEFGDPMAKITSKNNKPVVEFLEHKS